MTMTVSRRRAFIYALGCTLAASALAGEATITFRLNRSFRKAQKLPSYVVWVETPDGEYVTTVRMGQVAKVQDDQRTKGKPAPYFMQWDRAHMDVVKVDSITKATPWPGKSDRIKWDLTNAKGDTLPKGDYVLKIECQIEGQGRDKFAQITAMPFSIGGKTKFSRSRTRLLTGHKPRKKTVYIQKLSMKIRK